MLRIYADFNHAEQQALAEMRAWALSQGSAREHLIGKLGIAQRIVSSGKIGTNDIWKMNAVGVLFGDALLQRIGDRLSWVVVDDEAGQAYALSWQHTEVLVYPLAAVKSRMMAAEPVDLQAMFDEYTSLFPV